MTDVSKRFQNLVAKAIKEWNNNADSHNQWSDLGEDEKLEHVVDFALRQRNDPQALHP